MVGWKLEVGGWLGFGLGVGLELGLRELTSYRVARGMGGAK